LGINVAFVQYAISSLASGQRLRASKRKGVR
jgi:hypothetical protein